LDESAAVQRRDERDRISADNAIVHCILELPVCVIDKHEHTRPDVSTLHEHAVPLAHQCLAHPLDQVAHCRNGRWYFNFDALLVIEQVFESTTAHFKGADVTSNVHAQHRRNRKVLAIRFLVGANVVVLDICALTKTYPNSSVTALMATGFSDLTQQAKTALLVRVCRERRLRVYD
jgi:hypothetical protein